MRAGIFTKRIQIYREYKSVNEYGETITGNFEYVHSTRAEVTQTNGARVDENSNMTYTSLVTFNMRYYVDIRDYDRILYNDKFYRVLNNDRKDKQNYITVDTELVND